MGKMNFYFRPSSSIGSEVFVSSAAAGGLSMVAAAAAIS